jgi:hypothetical protein
MKKAMKIPLKKEIKHLINKRQKSQHSFIIIIFTKILKINVTGKDVCPLEPFERKIRAPKKLLLSQKLIMIICIYVYKILKQ